MSFECVFDVYGNALILSFSSFLLIILISWRVDLSNGSIFYFFSKIGGYNSSKSKVLGFLSWNLISAIKTCRILSSWDTLWSILLNSTKLVECSCLLIQPYGSGFVIACPYWLFSSIFSIFVEIIFVCFLPSMFKSNNTFQFLLPSGKISVSKVSLVLTKLIHQLVSSQRFWHVGRAIQHLDLSLRTHPQKGLAELHFRWLYLNSFCRYNWTLLKHFTKYYNVLKIVDFIKLT